MILHAFIMLYYFLLYYAMFYQVLHELLHAHHHGAAQRPLGHDVAADGQPKNIYIYIYIYISCSFLHYVVFSFCRL